MARAQGARAQMALAFETTYGTPPVSSFTKMPFASTSLGAEQPLQTSELLGYGRDPQAPIKDAVTADGDVVIPIDAGAFGFWLKAAFGTPTTTGAGPYTHEFRSGNWAMPSFSDERLISENRPPNVLWNDSFSIYLKPACRVFNSSSFWVRAMWAMLVQRCSGLMT